MAKCACKHDHDFEKRKKKKMLIIGLAALAIILLIIIIVYLAAYRPRDTYVGVDSLALSMPVATVIGGGGGGGGGGFGGVGGTLTFVNASILFHVRVYNPNRATYHAFGSDATLFFYGAAVGSLPIPAFDVQSRTSMDISFVLCAGFPPYTVGAPYLAEDMASGYLPLTSFVTIRGRVTTLSSFHHSGSSRTACSIRISLSTKCIETYVCK